MFTGIVQGLGVLNKIIQHSTEFRTHIVELPDNLVHNLKIGASISNNGCCLTITKIEDRKVWFDLMQETLVKTNLGLLEEGSYINLERAAKIGDEIGGHLMSGHISNTVSIINIIKTKDSCTIYFTLPKKYQSYILAKGFIGLDGCSLTVGDIFEHEFNVHLIPETLNKTLFGQRKIGDIINLEIDPQIQAVVDTVNHYLNSSHRTKHESK